MVVKGEQAVEPLLACHGGGEVIKSYLQGAAGQVRIWCHFIKLLMVQQVCTWVSLALGLSLPATNMK